MDINTAMTQNLASLRDAVGTAMLRKTMMQDTQSMQTLIQGMEQANAKVMEASVTPHLGGSIDLNV